MTTLHPMGRSTPRAVCISRDAGVRRVVGEVLANAGVTVEFAGAVGDISGDVTLIVVDRAARQAAGDALATASACRWWSSATPPTTMAWSR